MTNRHDFKEKNLFKYGTLIAYVKVEINKLLLRADFIFVRFHNNGLRFYFNIPFIIVNLILQ